MKKFFKNCLLGMSALTMALGFTACDEPEKITYADTYNDKTVSTVYEEVGTELETLVNQETRNYQVNMNMAMVMNVSGAGVNMTAMTMNMSMIDKICGQTEYGKANVSMSATGYSASSVVEMWYAEEKMYMKQTANGETMKEVMDMPWSEYQAQMGESVDTTIYDVDPSVLENVQFAIGDKNGCRFTVTITGEYMQPILDEALGMVEESGETGLPFSDMSCSDIEYTIYVNNDGTFKKANMVFDMIMTQDIEDELGGTQTVTYTMSFNMTMSITNVGKIAPITPPSDASSYFPSTYM